LRKGGQHAIANGFEDHPTLCYHTRFQDRIMARDDVRHDVLVLFPQARTAGDVGKEEGHRATWQRMWLPACVIWPDAGILQDGHGGGEGHIRCNIAGKVDEGDLIGWGELECIGEGLGECP
jgi:hypothetical protein